MVLLQLPGLVRVVSVERKATELTTTGLGQRLDRRAVIEGSQCSNSQGEIVDSAAVVAQLDRARSAHSRELDRICIQVASSLIDDGAEPDFEVESDDFDADPFLVCADRYWQKRLIALPTVTTAAACARWLEKHVAPASRPEIEQRWALGNGFVTRDNVETHAEVAAAAADITGQGVMTETIALFATLYHAGKLRSNRRVDELNIFLESSDLAAAAGGRRKDAVVVALQAFAAFGSRAMTTEHAIDLLEQAWDAPDRTRQVVDVCLAGIAESTPFPTQGELLAERAAQAITAYPVDHLFHYRLASGLHIRQRPDEALEAIDAALRLLPAIGSRISHQVLQQQYLNKREAIQEGRLRATWAEEQQQRWKQQDDANDSIREMLQSSAVRAVELVAIFTAAIAFAVGSLQVTLNGNLALRDRIWLLAVLGAGLAIFALLTIGGTWYVTGGRRRTRRN